MKKQEIIDKYMYTQMIYDGKLCYINTYELKLINEYVFFKVYFTCLEYDTYSFKEFMIFLKTCKRNFHPGVYITIRGCAYKDYVSDYIKIGHELMDL